MPTLEPTLHSLHFLGALYALTPHATLTLTAIHPDGKRPSPSRHVRLSDTSTLHKALHDLHAANGMGWGAYFSVANRVGDLGRWRRGGLADLAHLPALFVDVDAPLAEAQARLQAREPPPSCVVASGWGVHAYWFLDAPARDWTLVQRALDALRCAYRADKTSPVACLRLPGTRNSKPQRANAPCHVLTLEAHRYPLARFLAQPAKTVQTLQTGQTVQRGRARTTLNPHLIRAVSDRLQADYGGRWKRNGWLASRCPCPHERDGVGMHFSFNPDKGIGVCLGKHGTLTLNALCQRLSIRPSDYGGLYRKDEP
jgi:hypothetical protein